MNQLNSYLSNLVSTEKQECFVNGGMDVRLVDVSSALLCLSSAGQCRWLYICWRNQQKQEIRHVVLLNTVLSNCFKVKHAKTWGVVLIFSRMTVLEFIEKINSSGLL